MYTSKQFKVKDEEKVFAEIDLAAKHFPNTRKIFLADGNAMVLSSNKLLRILKYLNQSFPKLMRISAYAIAKDLNNKSIAELKEIQEAGLKLIYVGIESGDDELLTVINKAETSESTIDSMQKAKAAGIKSSVMIINGLGGKKFARQHAENSARVINAIQPEYLSTLVLSFPYGVDHYKAKFNGEFLESNIVDLLIEQQLFIKNLELQASVFRSDHASNYLVLKGITNRDKPTILANLAKAINQPEYANFRQEWQRGL
jgi:radical SAM superfamily enzyme YgiQ (UPF0313 family)